MKTVSCSVLILAVLMMGCGGDGTESSDGSTTSTSGGTTSAGITTTEPGKDDAGNAIALTPDNTDIVFIGTHANPDNPDPRTCEFTDFSGTATVEDGTLKAVEVTIHTEGISTFNPMLTDHLRNPDFFNVLEYPEAKFTSTSIESGDDGMVTITGNLTLLAETKPVTFPATVTMEDGLTLMAEFEIDRTEWGMTARQDGVLKDVTLQINIGG